MRCQEQLDQQIASLRSQQWTSRDSALATGTGRVRVGDVILNRTSAPNRDERLLKVTASVRDRIIGLTCENCEPSDQQIACLISVEIGESIGRSTVN
jgi:hypothetical protein